MANLPSYLDVKSGNHAFPNRDISEEEKNLPEYSLEYCQAIYNRYLNDKCGILYSRRETLDTIRLYGKGAQPVSIYKSWYQEQALDDSSDSLLSTYRQSKTRQGWENISTRVISPLPRIRTIIKGYVDQVGQDVFVDAIDPISNDMRDNVKAYLLAVAQNMDFINEYHMKAGLPMKELEFLPASQTELNLYESMGGFKMNYARVMEKLIRHTEQISEVNDELKDEWVDDAVDLGVLAARSIYDHNTKKYKYKYIDPKYFVIQFVREGDYSKSEWAGYIEPHTISELKQLLPDKEEDFFKNIAYQYRGKNGNKLGENEDWDNFSKYSSRTNSFNYDDWTVDVLEVEWIDYQAERHLVYDSVHGRKSVLPLGKNTKIKPLEEKQINRGARQEDLKTKLRKLRHAKWVIGTDIVYDYGLANMADRPRHTDVMHSFRLYTLNDLPITEQLIPIADDMAMAWYRWQNDRAMLPRSGYAIDIGMMDNIKMGDKDFSFEKLIKAWRETRHLIHQQSMSGRYEGGGITPVQPIQSMLLEALTEFITAWEAALKRIEDVTGINLVLLGATAPEGSQVTTTQMSAQSAVHVLKPIIKTVGRMKTELAETVMRRLQLAFKARPDIAKGYVDVVGEYDVELLKQAEKDSVQYGMVFENRPSEEMKQNIIAAATASLQARRDGKPGIDLSQFVYITQQLEAGGNIKELSALLDYLNLKAEQQVQANKERDIQLQNEGLQKIEQSKQQGEAVKDQRKLQGELMLEDKKQEGELRKIRAEKGYEEMQNRGVQPRSPSQPPVTPPAQQNA